MTAQITLHANQENVSIHVQLPMFVLQMQTVELQDIRLFALVLMVILVLLKYHVHCVSNLVLISYHLLCRDRKKYQLIEFLTENYLTENCTLLLLFSRFFETLFFCMSDFFSSEGGIKKVSMKRV